MFEPLSGCPQVTSASILGQLKCFLRTLSATLILSKNSRVLDAKSRQKIGENQLKIGPHSTRIRLKKSTKSQEIRLTPKRWLERTPSHYFFCFCSGRPWSQVIWCGLHLSLSSEAEDDNTLYALCSYKIEAPMS